MKPAWQQLEAHFADDSEVCVGDVDCTVNQDVCQKHGVRGYPTIKAFKDGGEKVEDYRSGRDFDSLKTFVTGMKSVGQEL